MADTHLFGLFQSFCAFGDRTGSNAVMDGSKFAKFARDCKVLDKKVSATEVDIAFARVKSSRKISFDEFRRALGDLAMVKYPGSSRAEAFDRLKAHVLSSGGPSVKATATATGGIYDKLLDESQYTGAHRARFGQRTRSSRDAGRSRSPRAADRPPKVSTARTSSSRQKSAGVRSKTARSRSPRGARPKTSSAKPSPAAAAWGDAPAAGRDLRSVFLDYCSFGGDASDAMPNDKFSKCVKEAGLTKRGVLSTTEVDIIFSKVKTRGVRRITYQQFLQALELVGEKVHPALDATQRRMAVIDRIVSHGGPEARGTMPQTGGFVGKLTDTSLYTGAHRARFGEAPVSAADRSQRDLPTFPAYRDPDLKAVFMAYTSFGAGGDASAGKEMGTAVFSKLARECGLITRRCPAPDVDLVFQKVKAHGAQRVTYSEFRTALGLLGTKSFPDLPPNRAFQTIVSTVVAHGGPEARATDTDTSNTIYDKLTDSSLYTGAHKHRFGKADGAEEEFQRRHSSRSLPSYGGYRTKDLRIVFQSFCAFGGATDFDNMDSAKVSKLCKETGLVCGKLTIGELDVMFSRVKDHTARKINFAQFQTLLGLIAEKLSSEDDDEAYHRVVDAVVDHGPPEARATQAEAGGVYAKLTDSKLYTGAHKHRFNADGTGAGNASPVVEEVEVTRAAAAPAAFSFGSFRAAELKPIFLDYCAFGGAEDDQMDNVKFAKLAREANLVDGKCNGIAVDIVFSKVRPHGARKISFKGFQEALGLIGMRKFPEMEPNHAYYRVVDAIINHGGPDARATAANTSGVYASLTDVSGYTGSHRARFNEDGTGAGSSMGTALPRKTSARGMGPEVPTFSGYRSKELGDVFNTYCAFGGSADSSNLDGARAAKLVKDTGLLSSRFTSTDADVLFSKTKSRGARRISFAQFEQFIGEAGMKAHPQLKAEDAYRRAVDQVLSSDGPTFSGTTADTSGIYSKLTDVSGYTGAHRARFNSDGTGAPYDTGDLGVELPRAARTAAEIPVCNSARASELHAVFVVFNEFGGGADAEHMDNATFSKLAREARLVSSTCSATDIDLVFTKAKSLGARKIDFQGFQNALGLVAVKKLPSVDPKRSFESIVDTVVSHGGPQATATLPDTGGVFSTLTDHTKYTGSHRHRFAADGTGVGGSGGAAAPPPRKGHSSTTVRPSTSSVPARRISSSRDVTSEAGDSAAGSVPETNPRLREVFREFCLYGGGSDTAHIDNAKLVKMVKDSNLLSTRCSKTDVDVIFSRCKTRGSRKLTYDQFVVALTIIAEKKYPQYSQAEAFGRVVDKVVSSGGPVTTGTVAQTGGIYGRLTDSSQYTGSHRSRFDEDGRGRGNDGGGRVEVRPGLGGIVSRR